MPSPSTITASTMVAAALATAVLVLAPVCDARRGPGPVLPEGMVGACPATLPDPAFGIVGGLSHGVTSPYDRNCAAEFAEFCDNTTRARPVCYNDTTYHSISCLVCNVPEHNPADIIQGPCRAEVFACPRPPRGQQPNATLFRLCATGGPNEVCGLDGVTYQNPACLDCNGGTMSSNGACPSLPSLEDCDCADSHAECTQTILACSFEGSLCSFDQYSAGWARTNGSALAAAGMAGPANDNTLRQSGVGGYLLTNDNGSVAYGPTVEPIFNSERCHLKFAYYVQCGERDEKSVVCGVQLSFGWSAELDTAPTAWLAVANATFRHGNWHRHQYPVPLSDNTDPSARIPVFSAIITGPGDFAAIDDVEIDCGASNATVGECQCMDGFANNATDGSVTCEAIPGEAFDREVADVVATCPERAECRGKTRCMFGAEDLVCATGTLYRNRACAGCNYELQSTVFDGYCPAAIANDDTISSCRGLPAQTNRTVQQNRSFSECHQGVEERVCYNHQNFRNFGCARCNGVQIPPNWPAGDCATVLAVSPDTISVDAGCERWELCGYEHENCTCTGMVRYGLDGVYTYQDSDGWIELENSNFNDPVLGSRKRGWCNVNSDLTICDSALCRNPRAPGCEVCRAVQQCTNGPTEPACFNGTNYRNLGCAECSARPTNQTTFRRALANGWCEALDPLSLVERGRPVVHNCSRPYNNESTAYPFVIAGRPARTLGYAELADGCANGPADPVCASGSNYYNMWCAICSDHDIADVSRNPCSRLNRTINETCPDTARTLPGALGCLFSGYNPVCGADGQTYKNAGCATCNGLLQPDMSRGACSTDDEVFDLCSNVACPANASCSLLESDCDFEAAGSDGYCGWSNGTNGAEWTIGHGRTTTDGTGPTVDHTTNSTDGQYLYLEASGLNAGERVELLSPILDSASFGFDCRLHFWYHMFGAHIGSLEVYLRYVQEGSSSFRRIQTIDAPLDSANPRWDRWRATDAGFGGGAVRGQVQIKLVAIRGTGTQGDIAIDDLQLICGEERGECTCDTGFAPDADATGPLSCLIDDTELVPTGNVTIPTADPSGNGADGCPFGQSRVEGFNRTDFESGYRGWMNEPPGGDDNFDWTYHRGHTPTNGTGPQVDHTYGNATGHYLYIEASGGQDGHQAHLLSPIINMSAHGNNCRFNFWYHLYGANVDNITVDIRALDAAGNETDDSAWTPSLVVRQLPNSAENVHDQWRNQGHVNIPRSALGTAQIRIRGFRGAGNAGDIAIDDLEISCQRRDGTGNECSCDEGFERSRTDDCVANVLTTIHANPDLSIALQFLEAAGLNDTLASMDGVTIFVANDDGLLHLFPANDSTVLDGYLAAEREAGGVLTLDYVMPRWLPGGQTGEPTLADGVLYPTIGNRSIMFNETTSSVMWPGRADSAREVLYSIPASNGNIFVLGGPLPFENPEALVCGATPCDASTHYCRNGVAPGAAGFYANLTNQQCDRCQVPFDWSQRDPSALVCAIRTGESGRPHYRTLMAACQARCLGYPLAYLGSCQISTCEAIGSTDAPSAATTPPAPTFPPATPSTDTTVTPGTDTTSAGATLAPSAAPARITSAAPATTQPTSAGATRAPTAAPATTQPTMLPTSTSVGATHAPSAAPATTQPTSAGATRAPSAAPATTQPTTLTTGIYSGVLSYLSMFTCIVHCGTFSGRATMTLAADGSTTVRVDVAGLAPNTVYPAHLHTSPCSAGNPGGGHYRSPVCSSPCTANDVNEIWPAVTTDSAGAGSGSASVAWQPLADDVHWLSVVIHDTAANGNGKMICADLNTSGVPETTTGAPRSTSTSAQAVISTRGPTPGPTPGPPTSTAAPTAISPSGTDASKGDTGDDGGSNLAVIIAGAAAVVVVLALISVVVYYKLSGGGGNNAANYDTREASFSNPLYGSNPLQHGEVMNDPDAASGGNGVSGGYMDVPDSGTGNGGGYMDVFPADSYGDDSEL